MYTVRRWHSMDNELQNYRATTLNMSLEFIEMLHLYNTCLTKILSKYNLYPGQPQLLITVRDSGNALTQNELAEKIGISKASIGTSLRRLEASGFVKRTRDKTDTRCIRVSLTKKGEEYARWCEVDYEMLFTIMLEVFSPDERNRMPGEISRMAKGLRELAVRLKS